MEESILEVLIKKMPTTFTFATEKIQNSLNKIFDSPNGESTIYLLVFGWL